MTCDEHAEWKRLATQELITLINSGNEFNADTLRARMTTINPSLQPRHPNSWGALFNEYSSLMKRVSFTTTRNKKGNGRTIFNWIGRDTVA